jgi:hypothetical protein
MIYNVSAMLLARPLSLHIFIHYTIVTTILIHTVHCSPFSPETKYSLNKLYLYRLAIFIKKLTTVIPKEVQIYKY